MSRIGLPVPPGLHHHHRSLHLLLRQQADLSQGARRRRAKAGIAIIEKIMGTKFGDKNAMPLLVSGAFRRARFHARHDGHDSEPRLERRDGAGAGRRRRRTSVLPGTVIAGSSRCMATWCMGVQKRPGEDHEPFEVVIDALEARAFTAARDRRHEADRRAISRNLVARFKALDQGTHRQGIPARSLEAALGRHRARCSVPG